MKRALRPSLLLSGLCAAMAWAGPAGRVRAAEEAVIVVAPEASPQVRLAAREVRRYVYLRTGALLPVRATAEKGQKTILLTKDGSLAEQSYCLKTTAGEGGAGTLTLSGGSDLAVLYAAYRFAETLGVRFYLHGDVVPDRPIPFAWPNLDETHAPLFATRGLLPFHDFTEGPDWWEADDYKAHFHQMAKMRMNLIGLHCYPEGSVGPEPLVWIGHPDDVGPDGKVRFSPPSAWTTTRGGRWGYAAMATGEYAAGGGLLFAQDDFGSSVTDGHLPQPQTPEACNEVFERAARMLRESFAYGRELGVKVCVGTETPLHIPASVQARLREKGLDPAAPEVRQQVYEGMFTRLARACPVDYYWLWTPESWTWSTSVRQAEIEATVRDVKTARAALEKVGNPFGFGTCGWELGPKQDRGLFDRILPADAVMSCINRNIGFNWVDREFLRLSERPKWAIPWLEDDSAMVLPQLFAGRVRRDAADALSYGCSGLLGIHWRTKVLAPNVSALAQAAWSQKGWNPEVGQRAVLPEAPTTDVRLGGQSARSEAPVAKTDESPVYQTCRFGLSGYRLTVPNGTYDVTLKFCEIAYDTPGKRVFGIRVEGAPLAERLDVAAKAGRHVAYDLVARAVKVNDEELNIDFQALVENPFIAGIVIEGKTDAVMQFESRPFARRINCGGGKWGAYEADLAAAEELPPMPERTRDLPCADFYEDLARAWFGDAAAAGLASFFARHDGDGGAYGVIQGRTTLPRPNTWMYGPGAMTASRVPWAEAAKRYAFVDELADFRGRIQSAGDRARFDYWLNTFRYLRSVDEAACARGALDLVMEQIAKESDPVKKKSRAQEEALPARIHLARVWEKMMTDLLAATDTMGEIGTLANLEQSTRRALKFVEGHDGELGQYLGASLPETVRVSTRYQGEPRIIVPTTRAMMAEGETPVLKVLVLDEQPPAEAQLFWRPMGRGPFTPLPIRHVARGVHEVTLPAVPEEGAEYYLKVKTAGGKTLVWPPTAPALNHTLVQMP